MLLQFWERLPLFCKDICLEIYRCAQWIQTMQHWRGRDKCVYLYLWTRHHHEREYKPRRREEEYTRCCCYCLHFWQILKVDEDSDKVPSKPRTRPRQCCCGCRECAWCTVIVAMDTKVIEVKHCCSHWFVQYPRQCHQYRWGGPCNSLHPPRRVNDGWQQLTGVMQAGDLVHWCQCWLLSSWCWCFCYIFECIYHRVRFLARRHWGQEGQKGWRFQFEWRLCFQPSASKLAMFYIER